MRKSIGLEKYLKDSNWNRQPLRQKSAEEPKLSAKGPKIKAEDISEVAYQVGAQHLF